MDDPRLTPARPDLAARYLEGKVTAARFADGETFEVIAPLAPLRDAPRADAMLQTEALHGERMTIYDRPGDGWAWGQLESDGYVGWLPDAALAPAGPAATHKVAALRTLVFPGPSIKLPPRATLTLGTTLAITRLEDNFAITPDGGYLPAQHLTPLGHSEPDFVAVAERFVGTPYLWGGKSSLGIDCSGLVQVSLAAGGVRAPRDSDMQEASLGADVPLSHIAKLQRGDLLFWKGHVAIARDAMTLVHANAHHMATAIEPTHAAIARIAAAGSAVRRIGRL
ncbi:MAG: C40 family peptidase [Xanthobacteraceae bacterium]